MNIIEYVKSEGNIYALTRFSDCWLAGLFPENTPQETITTFSRKYVALQVTEDYRVINRKPLIANSITQLKLAVKLDNNKRYKALEIGMTAAIKRNDVEAAKDYLKQMVALEEFLR